MDKDFWYKLLNPPTIIFYYDQDERDIYERTKKGLQESLDKPRFILEWNDETLVIKVWRKTRKI